MMQELIDRIRAEYLEMPGMTLTVSQAARLCGVEPAECKTVLKALVEAKFLGVTADGAYARVTNESTLRARPARATLDSGSGAHVHRRRAG